MATSIGANGWPLKIDAEVEVALGMLVGVSPAVCAPSSYEALA